MACRTAATANAVLAADHDCCDRRRADCSSKVTSAGFRCRCCPVVEPPAANGIMERMEINLLTKDLASDNPGTRVAAAEELARLGESAQTAAVPLVKAMGDSEGGVRDWALAALESLGPP